MDVGPRASHALADTCQVERSSASFDRDGVTVVRVELELASAYYGCSPGHFISNFGFLEVQHQFLELVELEIIIHLPLVSGYTLFPCSFIQKIEKVTVLPPCNALATAARRRCNRAVLPPPQPPARRE